MRVNDLARELGVKTKVILALLPSIGIQTKHSHSSSLSEEEVKRLREHSGTLRAAAIRSAHGGTVTPAPTILGTNALVPCTVCGSPVRHDRMDRHITRVHNGERVPIRAVRPAKVISETNSRVPKTLRRLVRCPNCGLHFHEDRLQEHIGRRHREKARQEIVRRLPTTPENEVLKEQARIRANVLDSRRRASRPSAPLSTSRKVARPSKRSKGNRVTGLLPSTDALWRSVSGGLPSLGKRSRTLRIQPRRDTRE